jgi:molybdate transport system substrate-binding protein
LSSIFNRFGSVAFLAIAVSLLPGCIDQDVGDKDDGEKEPDILLLCGGSFKAPGEKLVAEYKKATGRTVTISFGQSEDLLPHVKNHAQGDLFLSHDPYAKYTADAKAESRTVVVGYLRPVLVVKKGNPKGIKSVEDLAKPGLRVALLNPEFSTCGKMVADLIEKKGLKEKVMANVGNALFRSHTDIATGIKMDQRDAGLMWNGVTGNYVDVLEVVPTPAEYEEVRVTISGLSYSKNAKEVEAFLKFAETRGPEVFKEFGYVK